MTLEKVVRCFEPFTLFGGVCIATDCRIAAHIFDCHRTLIEFLVTGIECLSLIPKRGLHCRGHEAEEEPSMRRVPCPEVVRFVCSSVQLLGICAKLWRYF